MMKVWIQKSVLNGYIVAVVEDDSVVYAKMFSKMDDAINYFNN